jgi:hypothetical protein
MAAKGDAVMSRDESAAKKEDPDASPSDDYIEINRDAYHYHRQG